MHAVIEKIVSVILKIFYVRRCVTPEKYTHGISISSSTLNFAVNEYNRFRISLSIVKSHLAFARQMSYAIVDVEVG